MTTTIQTREPDGVPQLGTPQRVDTPRQLHYPRLGLTEHPEQDRGDLQGLLPPLFAGLERSAGPVEFLIRGEGLTLRLQHLP